MTARKDMSGSGYAIKKIQNVRQMGGGEKTVITIRTGGLPTCDIWIEEAIAACEVTPCNNQKSSAAEKHAGRKAWKPAVDHACFRERMARRFRVNQMKVNF